MEDGYRLGGEGQGEVAFGSPPRRGFLHMDNSHQSEDVSGVGALHSMSTHKEYPPTQPFIYDDYRRDPNKTTKAHPESNRQAVMSALRSLQEKIRHLELERTRAEDNLKSLATETDRCRDMLDTAPSSAPTRTPQTSPARREPPRETVNFKEDNRPKSVNSTLGGDLTQYADTTLGTDVHNKLDSAEQRCQLLERQLDCMRRLVTSAEHDRSEALRRSSLVRQHQDEVEASDLQSQMGKISDLEREHLKLTATQTMAESKIRELEERLREERHYRKMMQDKAAELESSAEANRILLQATGASQVPATTKKTKRKKKRPAAHPNSGGLINGYSKKRPHSGRKQPGMEPSEHYKLNLADIPFIAGKSAGPSHSLPANFQEVLAIMKNHNTKLCTSPRSHTRNYYRFVSPAATSTQPSSKQLSLTDRCELAHLLMQLQEEFAQLTSEHEELSRQIHESSDLRLRDDLERELDAIVTKMEAKGNQIARLRRHQETLSSKRKKLKLTGGTASSGYSTAHSIPAGHDSSDSGEVQVTTTVRTKGKSASPITIKSGSFSKAQASLNVYKDLKKIQTTLRKDDVSWD